MEILIESITKTNFQLFISPVNNIFVINNDYCDEIDFLNTMYLKLKDDINDKTENIIDSKKDINEKKMKDKKDLTEIISIISSQEINKASDITNNSIDIINNFIKEEIKLIPFITKVINNTILTLHNFIYLLVFRRL